MNPVRHKLAPDQLLFTQGDAQTSFFLLIQGVVSLSQVRDGKTFEIARAAQNTVVGEIGYFKSQIRTLTAKAVNDCELLEFRFEDITASMKTLPPWASLMFRDMGERMQQSLKNQRAGSADETPHQLLDDLLRAALVTRMALLTLGAAAKKESSARVGAANARGAAHSAGTNADALTGASTAASTGSIIASPYVASWAQVREYAFQTFTIPLSKLEPVVNRLGELGWLEILRKESEISELRATPSQLARVAKLEEFIRFYRHSKHAQILEMTGTDELLLRGLITAGSQPDIRVHHGGSVTVPLEQALNFAQRLAGGEKLRADQFDLLLTRGLDLQKQSTDQGVMIAFQFAESRDVLENWQFLLSFSRHPTKT